MPRALKVFRAHLGFYESVVAAPSQKAAAAAWGSDAGLFQHKTAAQTENKDAVEAALAKPGVVLRRPFGSRGAFKENPDLPKVPKLAAAEKRKLTKQRRRHASEKLAERKREKAQEEKRTREELDELDRREKEIEQRRTELKKKVRGR